ncbi:MAG: extracellular solute-binding protein [Caldilineaceae bacterium]|nr:extracellular solute-binding protein [Caldilineaceae bacterium]
MQDNNLMSRRRMLKLMGLTTAGVALAACAPAASPSTGGSSDAAAPSAAQKEMSIATYADPRNEWQRTVSKAWAEANPDVNLNIDEIIYGEMNKKQQAAMATDTLWDVSFSGVKWFPYLVARGAFVALEDLIAANDPDMEDFFSASLAGSSFEGKLYGLPYLMHPGNPALIIFNLNLLGEKGLEPPADNNWTTDEYAQLATDAADPDNMVFGTNLFPGNYYDHCSFARTYGGDILDETHENFTFNVDPASIEAARWVTDLRTVHRAAPNRAEAEGLQFAAGTMATATLGTYAVRSLEETIAGSFEYALRLFPNSPEHERGYQAFVECFSVAAQSEYPTEAFDLTVALTSTAAGIESVLASSNQPTARKSVWTATELEGLLDPIFMDALEWMSEVPGPFPHPSNLRFQELQDTWANISPDLFYGEVSFEEGMQAVQDACQEIMQLPRP